MAFRFASRSISSRAGAKVYDIEDLDLGFEYDNGIDIAIGKLIEGCCSTSLCTAATFRASQDLLVLRTVTGFREF